MSYVYLLRLTFRGEVLHKIGYTGRHPSHRHNQLRATFRDIEIVDYAEVLDNRYGVGAQWIEDGVHAMFSEKRYRDTYRRELFRLTDEDVAGFRENIKEIARSHKARIISWREEPREAVQIPHKRVRKR